MSAHRELKNAQQALNEAVEMYLDIQTTYNYGSFLVQDIKPLQAAWDEYAALRRNLDGPGAASARQTSINAGMARLPLKSSLRFEVIQTIVAHHASFGVGMTCAELCGRLRRKHQSVSSVVNFADEHGFIRDSGQKRPTPDNMPAIVWEPTDLAITMFRDAALGKVAG